MDDPDIIHFDNSSDLPLSTSLNDLDNATLHIDGQSTVVDAPPDIIDVPDEDDDIIGDEDALPHDLADSDVEDLINASSMLMMMVLRKVFLVKKKIDLELCRQQMLHGPTRQRPRPDQLVRDKQTLMPLGDHAAHWSSYIGEIIRGVPLYYPSCLKVPKEQKAALITDIRVRTLLEPLKIGKTRQRARSYLDRDPSRLLAFEMRWQSSATQEYMSLIDTFFVAHTVNGVFTRDEDRLIYEEMKRLEATGEYTEDEINALARGGKLRRHIPGVGRVLPVRATSRPKSDQNKYADMFKELASGGARGLGAGCYEKHDEITILNTTLVSAVHSSQPEEIQQCEKSRRQQSDELHAIKNATDKPSKDIGAEVMVELFSLRDEMLY
ncbi:hypothetical protein Tco_0755521 [Tanacetum coccineum]